MESQSGIIFIIFTKDRAMQFDALCQSIRKYVMEPHVMFPIVGFSNSDYERAYDESEWLVISEHWFGFKGSVLYALKSSVPGRSNTLVSFLVDDDLFYRPLPEFSISPGEAYAPRLGFNCTYCYTVDRPQQVPTQLWRDVGGEGDLDFDYTLSMDGHVYITSDILPFFEAADYNNPNDIENALSGSIRPRLKFAPHSCLVGIPNNSVGPMKGNRHGGGDPAYLNQLFLDGWRIAIDEMDFSCVRSVHQEIPYVLRRGKERMVYG